MNTFVRRTCNNAITVLTAMAVLLIVIVLIGILGPMIWRGIGAVFFRGTVEFREMQMSLFGRGNEAALVTEIEKTQQSRAYVYNLIDEFKAGVDTENLTDQAREIHREFGKELRYRNVPDEKYHKLRSLTRNLRDKLITAFESDSKEEIKQIIDEVLQYRTDERLQVDTAQKLFELAQRYQKAVSRIDLKKRREYAGELQQMQEIISRLLGPRPDEPEPPLARHRYGATRWDRAQILLHKLMYKKEWVQQQPGKPLVEKQVPRITQFAGTTLEPLFEYVDANLDDMLNPRRTFYWRYFFDDSTPDHLYGGIWPEILGTLVITLLSMFFVIPLGVISAAYLVECAPDNFLIRFIRMCINTLAGVPSIVFGLFGLAFFVNVLLPAFGGPSKRCVIAASLTLAVLTLPVMIRASEEAIRTVPKPYKEASLALGASHFRTFIHVTLPAALPGILTGVILSLSRVAGETAPIIFTGAVASGSAPSFKSLFGWLFQSTPTLSFGSYATAVKEDLTTVAPHKQYGMVVTLILLVLCLNAIAIVMRTRVFKKLHGR